MAAPVLQFKRGLLANLPGLRVGEPGFTTDSYDLYVGIDSTTTNNKFFGSHRYWTRGTATTGSGVNLVEATNNGTQYVTLKSPDNLAGIVTYTFPGTQGASSSVLTNDGNGNLTWASGSANPVFTGIATFSDTTDNTLGNADTGAVQIDGGLGINKNLTVGQNLHVAGYSNFVGVVTFQGGTINLGDANTDNVNVAGEFISNLNPNTDATYNLGIATQRWNNFHFSGIGTIGTLSASTVLATDADIANLYADVGIVTVARGTSLNYTGISTVTTLLSTNLQPTNINASGITTLTNATGTNLNFTGVGTITTLGVTNLTPTRMNISGISTITTLVGTNINYSGVGTIATLNSTVATLTNLGGTNINYTGVGTITTLNTTNLRPTNLSVTGITTLGTGVGVTQFSSSVSTGTSTSSVPTSSAVIDYVGTQVANVDLTTGIAGDSGTGTVNTSQTLTVAGTSQQVTTSASNQTITLSLPSTVVVGTAVSAPTLRAATIQHQNGTNAATIDTSGNITAAQNLTVTGNLYVNGSTTQVDSTSITVEDRTLELGMVSGGAPSGATTWDLGVLFNYNSSGAKKSGVIWEHADSRFKFASQLTADADADPSTTSNPQITITNNTGYASIEIKSLWVNDCAGVHEVISCSGTTRSLNDITIDCGSF